MSEKQLYTNMYNKMESTKTYLNNAISKLNEAIKYSKNAIVIDGVSYKKADIERIKNNLVNKRDSLVNLHMKAVKQKIAGLK